MTPEELAQGQLEAYNDRDLERFVSFYADDVIVYGVPSGEKMRGKQVMAERYKGLFESSPQLCCTLVSRMVMGPWVIDQEDVTGHASNPDGQVEAVAIYLCQSGKIDEVRFLDR